MEVRRCMGAEPRTLSFPSALGVQIAHGRAKPNGNGDRSGHFRWCDCAWASWFDGETCNGRGCASVKRCGLAFAPYKLCFRVGVSDARRFASAIPRGVCVVRTARRCAIASACREDVACRSSFAYFTLARPVQRLKRRRLHVCVKTVVREVQTLWSGPAGIR